MSETVFITGVLGQDGAYLAELALKAGHRVVGGVRRSSSPSTWRLAELGIESDVELVDFELLEGSNIRTVIERVKPDRLFNLAAQSFVGTSFDQPIFTSEVDAIGPLRVLDAIRSLRLTTRFYQASTSEMFGQVSETPQRETTVLHPRSPYGVAKTFAHLITRNYREAYGMHASSGILFNHESPLRGEQFVTRKISMGIAAIAAGRQSVLRLGNLDASRDWGHARDYVRGMWMMTDQAAGGEFVLASGRTCTVRDFVKMAASAADMDIEFEGEGVDTVGVDKKSGVVIVRVDPAFFRPAEVDFLLGDASKARDILGWQPEVSFEELAKEMVEADIRRISASQHYSIR